MSEAEIQPQELVRTPELLGVNGRFDGMQGRFLLSDQNLLNPDVAVAIDDPRLKRTVSFEERNYSVFQKTSTLDRKEYWEDKVSKGAAQQEQSSQYISWSEGMQRKFKLQTNKAHLESLHTIFTSIGVNEQELDAVQAKKLYDRYFSNAQAESGVKQFVKDVLAAYRTADGLLDVETLNQHGDDIKWLSGIFGGPSSEIISELIQAEAGLIDWTENSFIDRLNEQYKNPDGNGTTRIVDLNDDEKYLLNHLIGRRAAVMYTPVTTSSITTPSDADIDDDENLNEEPDGSDELPVLKRRGEIVDWMKSTDPKRRNLVLIAGTGAGKSTEVPKMFEETFPDGKMIMIVPRINITENVAGRMAETTGTEVGEIYGLQHGKRTAVSKDTKVFLYTNGLLIQKMLSSRPSEKLLLNTDCVMIDERHENGTDVIIAEAELLKIQKERERLISQGIRQVDGIPVKPLRIISASATMNAEKRKKRMGEDVTEVMKIPGRAHKVTPLFDPDGTPPIDYKQMKTRDLNNHLATHASDITVSMLKQNPKRHSLIFMPGESAINGTISQLNTKLADNNISGVKVKPYIGTLPKSDQDAAKQLNENETSVIAASSIAESGITFAYTGKKDKKQKVELDVVMSGYVNIAYTDPVSGFNVLETLPASQDRLKQQAGRAGRNAPGVARFIGTRAEYAARPREAQSQMKLEDPSSALLRIKRMGYRTFEEMGIPQEDLPDRLNMARAIQSLKILGALDEDENITAIGKRMAEIPTDPHRARMIVDAIDRGCGRAMCSIVAVMNAKQLFIRPNGADGEDRLNAVKDVFGANSPESDYMSYYHIWNQFEQNNRSEQWAKDHYLVYENLLEVAKEQEKLIKRLGIAADVTNDITVIERSIFEGLRDRILVKHQTDNRYTMTSNPLIKTAQIDRHSALNKMGSEPAIIAVGPDQHIRSKPDLTRPIYLSMCHVVRPEWLKP